MKWSAAEKLIGERTAEILATTAINFEREISSSRVWPVGTETTTGIKGYKGGTSRRAWHMEKVNDLHYEVINDVSGKIHRETGELLKQNYSALLWLGYRHGGSMQLPLGGEPIYKKHQRILERKLKGITK